MPDPLNIYYRDNYLKFYVPNQSNSVDINNNGNNSPQQTNNKKKYSRRKNIKNINNNNNNDSNNNINDTGNFAKSTLLRNKGKYKTLKKNRKLSINGLHHHHNQAPYYHYQNRHLNVNNHVAILPNHTPFYLFNNNDLYNYQYSNDMNITLNNNNNSNNNKKSRTDIYSNSNNSYNNLFTPAASTPSPPMFDKDIIDTFCFHWPEKHCYVLVKILPTSIAILPIRHSRLAFLYFCYAPRPRQPSLTFDSLESHPSRRFQEVFQSWKNTLTFHDASSSSSSSSSHSVSSSDELEDFKKLKREQQHQHHKDYLPSTSTTPLSIKVNSTNGNKNNSSSNSNTNNDNNHHSIMDSTHSADLKDDLPVLSSINMNENNNNNNYSNINKNINKHLIDMDTTKSKPVKYHHHHPRHHPTMKSQEQNNNININIHDSDDNIVTLSDVIHHQLNINSCWIHAPCQLIEEEKEDGNNSYLDQDEDEDEKKNSHNNDNKFIILQSKNTTLKLKARCISEKSMFINLFKLNQLTHSLQNFNNCSFPSPHSISATHLLDIWQKKNQSLIEKLNDITVQVEKYKMEVKFYHQKCEELEEALDNTYDALTFHKENRLGYSETKSIMTTTHKKLSYYRDQFKQVQHRLDKLGTSSSSSWILDNAFRHYERFKQFHLINHIFYHLGVSAGIGIIVVIVAIALGYYYHY